jgi:hypothetical protein
MNAIGREINRFSDIVLAFTSIGRCSTVGERYRRHKEVWSYFRFISIIFLLDLDKAASKGWRSV